MAIDAHAVLFLNRLLEAGHEVADRRALLPATDAPGVGVPGAVAGFALQLTIAEGTGVIARKAVRRAKDLEHGRVVVTGETGVGAFARIGR